MRTLGVGGGGKNGHVFGCLRRNVGGTNQIADRVIGHQRSCEYHAVCVKTKMLAPLVSQARPSRRVRVRLARLVSTGGSKG